MLEKAKMINQLRKMQKELKKMKTEATAGDGAVTVVVNGEQKVEEVRFDSNLVNEDNIDSLALWTKSATNQAISDAQQLAATKMQEMPGIGDLNLPGM